MARIYVAGAYNAGNVMQVLDNIRNGMRWSTRVMLLGHAPFCPWQDFHFQLMLRENETLTIQDYYNYSLEWLRASDYMFVTPGWENSTGTRAEIKEAHRLGIPVFFNIEDIPDAIIPT